MIPSTQEIQSAVYGAWLLFRLDPRGMSFFEDSPAAFWRSFFAAVIVAPGFAILAMIDLAEAEVGADLPAVVLIEAIAYVVVWIGFPLALYYVCQGLDREDRFVRTVIALNWSTVVQIAIVVPVHLIVAGGLLSPGLSTLAIVVVALVTLFYSGFIARTALEVSPPIAALVVAVDVIISFAVQALVNAMLA